MTAEAVNKSSLRKLTTQERRKYRRVIYKADAKCMWKNGEEFTASTVDLGGGGLSLATDQPYKIGDDLVIYVDGIGRFAGKVARSTAPGFAVSVSLVPHKRDKVVDQLTWLINKEQLGLEDERRSTRRAAGGAVLVTYETGMVAQCNVLDLSVQGVGLRTDSPRPEIGARVKVGSRIGRCARYVDGGFAVEFRA